MAIQGLSEKEIAAQLQEAALWQRKGQEITRTFVHSTFADSIKFVNQVAAYADEVDHHPDILIKYNKVTLTLSTHDAGGLTKKDFDSARKADELFAKC
ncbi:MAG: 4a-hydroxytetrahydrobiopterin dehydratase [Bdellovibrionota bacterium]